jgi:hypothetical protein
MPTQTVELALDAALSGLMIDVYKKCFIPESAASSASSTVGVGLMMAMT